MKKFYTKRQITESIRFWENVLKRINESKSPLLDACVKQFGEDVVFGGKKLFELYREKLSEKDSNRTKPIVVKRKR